MSVIEYYTLLGLTHGCSVDEIKKAYRKKAREYHPDVNSEPYAKDMFILVTEAYEFLLTYSQKLAREAEAYDKAMDDWRKYRQSRSRQRANVYAQTSYVRFRNTKFYRSTKIFDGTTIVFSFGVSLMVLVIAVAGYFYRLKHPVPGLEDPSVWVMITFVLFGMFLFVISFIYLKAFLEKLKNHDNKR